MQPDFSKIGPLLFAALVVFAVYRRFRRSFGRQPLRPGRMSVRIALLAVVGCALLPMAMRSAQYQNFAPASMVTSPLTVGIFFVLAGYYLWYYGWVLWKSKHLKAEDIEGESLAAAP